MEIRPLKTEADYEAEMAEIERLFDAASRGLSQQDIAPYFGDDQRAKEALKRNRKLSVSMIRRLNKGPVISADILIQPYKPGAAQSRPASLG